MDLEKLAIIMKEGFDAVDARFDSMQAHMDQRFNAVERRLDAIEADIRELREEVANVKQYSKDIDYTISRIGEIEKELVSLRQNLKNA